MDAVAATRQVGMQASGKSEAVRVKEAFTQFVGESFYAQMQKAMRSSLGKPAYFHGGRAEEIFTSQLDQALAEQLADKSSDRFVDPLFEQQFPALAEQLKEESKASLDASDPIAALRRM
jgi:hypothetical protein